MLASDLYTCRDNVCVQAIFELSTTIGINVGVGITSLNYRIRPHRYGNCISLPEACRGQGGGDLFVAFNAYAYSYTAKLPELPEGKYWSRVVDTNLPPPKDFTAGGNKGVEPCYIVNAFSAILLMTKTRT